MTVKEPIQTVEPNQEAGELLVNFIKIMPIELQGMPFSELRKGALAHFNGEAEERARRYGWPLIRPASRDSYPPFLDRITLNFIRHKLCPYDQILSDLELFVAGPARKAARNLYILRVFRKIARTWPELAPAVEEQLQRRGLVGKA